VIWIIFADQLRLTLFSASRVFGFLIGTVLAGSGLYYYVVDEYKISNRLLVEDIYVSWPLLVHPFFSQKLLRPGQMDTDASMG
jgi:hypothetical protein